MVFFAMVFVSFLGGVQAWAVDYDGLIALCSQKNKQCLAPEQSQLIRQVEHQCQMQLKVLSCEGLSKDDPSMLAKIRRCDFNSICKETSSFLENKNSACWNGYKNSLIDTGVALKDAALAVPEFVQRSWSQFVTNVENKNAYIKKCESSVVEKRKLVKDDPRYNKMTDAQLNKYSAAFLYVQAESMRGYKASQQRASAVNQQLPLEQITAQSLGVDQKNQLEDMATIISDRLKKEYAKYSCYNELTQREMACYMIGNVVDPTILFGAAFKAGRLAGVVAKTVKAEELSADIGKINNGRRLTDVRAVSSVELFGQRLKTLKVVNLPPSMAIAEYKSVDGTTYKVFERAVKIPSGEVKKVLRELPVDSLTGAFDANYPAGREFLEGLLKEKSGEVSFAFIDVNNLGYVNKNFTNGRVAGDLYLKKVADAISKATEGKAQMFKLGGDEFGLVIHETDPKKIKDITDKILRATYSKDVHDIFKAEKIANARKARQGEMSLQEFKDFAPYSKEGISMGTTQVASGESFEAVLHRAEEQAKAMKIKTKEALNMDATKYGGAGRDPSKRSNLTYVPESLPVVEVSGATSKGLRSPSLSAQAKVVEEIRQREIYRFGQMTVAQYKDELGQIVNRYERYLPGDQRTMVSREVVMSQRTGFIDGTHEGGRQVLQEFVNTQSKLEKSLLWINTENLGKVNYFQGGTKAGDNLLKATSAVVKREIGEMGIPFKMHGSEMIVAVKDIPADKFVAFQKKLESSLVEDPQVKKVFSDQKKYLESQLNLYHGNAQKKSEIVNALAALEKIKPQFTLKGLSVQQAEPLPQLLEKLKAK